ncbi:hypothetical protein FRC17_002242 [Serendipita sp. 399]|nr:hypothetical protein FRC17_002242 [Serendipita sp. 399]
MPVSPVPYDVFTTSNGGFVNEGGPWYYDRSSLDVNIGSQNGVNWCRDVPWCITAWTIPSASLTFYSVSFFTNISIDMNQYANSNSLQCTFSYKPLWISTKSAEGTAIPMKLVVGSSSFEDTITAGNFDRVFTAGNWEGPTITHDADIPLTRNRGSSTVYVPVYINVTYPRLTGDHINYYVKSATFRINTASSGGTTTTGSAAGTSSSGIGFSPEPRNDQTTLIAAVVMGVLLLFSLIALGFLTVKYKRIKSEKKSTVNMIEEVQTSTMSNVTPFVFPPVTSPMGTHQGTESLLITSSPPETEASHPAHWNTMFQIPPSTRPPISQKGSELPPYRE